MILLLNLSHRAPATYFKKRYPTYPCNDDAILQLELQEQYVDEIRFLEVEYCNLSNRNN
jgi:hypothetical protein